MTKKKGKVLVLDDELIIAMSLSDDLEEAGFEIIGPFSKASEAMAALEQTKPDAAFLDINLGSDRNSFEVASNLKKSGTPFVFLTGYSEKSPAAEEFPDAAYLGKPVTGQQAVEEAEKLINGA
ncbi:MAG: response regulator [Pseudomonadota bacterium]